MDRIFRLYTREYIRAKSKCPVAEREFSSVCHTGEPADIAGLLRQMEAAAALPGRPHHQKPFFDRTWSGPIIFRHPRRPDAGCIAAAGAEKLPREPQRNRAFAGEAPHLLPSRTASRQVSSSSGWNRPRPSARKGPICTVAAPERTASEINCFHSRSAGRVTTMPTPNGTPRFRQRSKRSIRPSTLQVEPVRRAVSSGFRAG